MTATLPVGTHVIYFGSIRDEFAESYSVQGPCDCPQCTSDSDGSAHYRLRGEHVRWDPHAGAYERVGGTDLAHVDTAHILPSPDGPQPWQINQQTLSELGIHYPA